jgi:predicted DNA-binding transcriptional regulator AlpA
MSNWPQFGFVTLKQVLGKYGGPIPCGPTRWWEGVKTGEFLKPLKVAGRTVWRVSDIDALITRLEQQDAK